MAVLSLVLSIFATIVSVAVTLRDKWNSRFHQETSIIAAPYSYAHPASKSYLLLDAVTTNHSTTPFAITSAHLWIETKPMMTGDVDHQTRIPKQDYYGVVPSFTMWSEKSGDSTVSYERSTGLPVVVPANSAVHYRIAIATPDVFLWPEFSDGIRITLATSVRNKYIELTSQAIRPKLQTLETYMTEVRQTLPMERRGWRNL